MMNVKLKGSVVAEFGASLKVQNRKILNECVQQLKQATPVDTGRARDGWFATDDKLINNVPYIDALNHGHSDQAPSHFIEKTLLGISGVYANGLVVRTR